MTTRPEIARWLAPFAKVRAGEGAVVLLMSASVFAILCAYYLLKTAREGLILSGGMLGLRGDELKIYAGGAMALLFALIVPAYSTLASRVRRIRLINVSYAIVLVCLLAFFGLGRAGVPIGLAFFIWLGLVNMFLVAQFWSYANDLYTEEQGKRLFAIIAIGASAGAIVGPRLTAFAETYTLLVLAAVLLLACLAVINTVDRLVARAPAAPAEVTEPIGGPGGFALIARERYLLLIGAMLIVANLVNTTGEYVLSNAAADHAAALVPAGPGIDATAERREVIKAFYGDFYFWVNVVGFVIQAFVVSRVIAWLGIRGALFVLPAIVLGTYGAIAAIGGLAITRATKIAENATDYSLQNTVRHALFLPTSRAVKYKAKAALDTFFVRFGDTLSAVLVGVALHTLGLGVRGLALVNVAMVGLWLAIAVGIASAHRRIGDPAPAPGAVRPSLAIAEPVGATP